MFVHHASHSLLFRADPAVIAASMPAVAVSGPGYDVAAKHTAAATLALRGMGFDAPSPIASYYDWPRYKGRHKPFEHQKVMAEFMTLHSRCFNLGEMGTGKTNSVMWASDWLMECGDVRRMLILSPLSTLDGVWMQGVHDTIMHRTAAVVHGSREKRLAAIASDAEILVMNHDGLKIGPVREALRRLPDLDLIVVDEGSKFKNAKTDRYRGLEQLLSDKRRRLWWLTGTPCSTGPEDAWAQVRLVNPDRVPRFFGQWRSMVSVEIGMHQWKPRAGHQHLVHDAMQPAIRVAKSECLDLPPMTTMDLTCEMSPEQAAAYKEMSTAMQTAQRAAEEQGGVVTAVNAADRINKLRQIMLGSVKCGPSDYITYDCAPRAKVILDAIESASAKVLVIVPFKGAILELAKVIGKHHTVAVVNGDVPIGKRNAIFRAFKETADPHVLLCHPEVMSHGLSLTEADTLIFAGPMYGNDSYRQVIERINRPPQTKAMTMVRVGCNALEWSIYRALDSDENQQRLILDLYRSVVGRSNVTEDA